MKAAFFALLAVAAASKPALVDETSVEFLSVSEMVQADSPKGNVTIYGDMNVQGSLRTTSIQSSNLTVDGSLNVNADLKASKLKVDNLHADFVEKVSGWTPVKVSSCGSEDKFLGGHCNFAADTASKTFKNLPAHTQVRMTARFHFLDKWDGEQAYASLDGKNVWADSTKAHRGEGVNMCGSSHPERKFSAPIDVTIPHTGSAVEVKFGTSIEESVNACEQSWGVDDVTIYVK